MDQGPRGGGQLYKGERFFYARIYDRWMEYDENGEAVFSKTEDMWDFIFGKLVPT